MARNFIPFNEVAQLLGVSENDLAEMRSQNKIYGYRDGSAWKFKLDEVQRVAAERGIQLSDDVLRDTRPAEVGDNLGSGIDADLNELVDVGDSDESDSILVSDDEPGSGGEQSASSTVIGKDDQPDAKADSDLKLAGGGSDIEGLDLGSDIQLDTDGKAGSDVKPTAGGSDVLAGGSGVTSDSTGSGGKLDLGDDAADDLKLELAESSDVTSDSDRRSSSDLSLGEGSDAEAKSPGAGGSEVDLDADLEFSADDDDDDLVLGSGVGSDVTLGSGDSGIALTSPSDSGISLTSPSDSGLSLSEEPLELGGGTSDTSLELPEEIISLDEDGADSESPTQLKADDDFMLTPAMGGGEDSDSGSQVIALDTEESYDEEGATMLGTDAMPITEGEDTGFGTGPSPSPSILPPVQAVEAPYSVWNILSLTLIVLFLAFTGMLMTDLLRHIWSWEQPYPLNSVIMDEIIKMLGGQE